MGYRLRGQVRRNDEGVGAAPVSLEVTLQTAEDGSVRFWDSEEYNRLVWSQELGTFVTGPEVRAPISTDPDGYWEYVVPKGHGAPYQREGDRRDDTPETAREPLRRYVEKIEAVYRGRRAVVEEGEIALLSVDSARLEITATPGAWVRAGVMEDAGQMYQVPPSGVVELSNLPEGGVSLVQFQRAGTGEWDPRFGAPRVWQPVRENQTAQVDLGPLEQYPDDGSVACGRVYRSAGVPAGGVSVLILSEESGQILGTAAVTDAQGFWSVDIPEEGLGGNLYLMDPDWGSLPVVGRPYSDVVLGARMYSAWIEEFASEVWRRDALGHKNFTYVPGSVWVMDNDTAEVYETEPAPYGGWMTRQTLPKWKYVANPVALLTQGPQLRSYRIEADQRVEDPSCHLRGQSFSGWADQPSYYRATGYYPEKKILLGGKIKYHVALGARKRIEENWPEAARVGLEWGSHQPFVEMRAGEVEPHPPTPLSWQERGEEASPPGPLSVQEKAGEESPSHAEGCFTDWLCPYCGGPVARWAGRPVPRGYCEACADAWGTPRATDARGYGQSRALPAGRWEHRVMALTPRGGCSNRVRYHWRPDLYEETDEFLLTGGPGMATNAPRWWALHPHEVLDGKGLGVWRGDQSPPYLPGRSLAEYGALLGRELGLAQLKLAFPPGWIALEPFALEVDCERADETVETLRVEVPLGTCGPIPGHPLGDVIALSRTPKLRAEGLESPYATAGLYRAVRDIRLVEPESAPGSRAVVTADVPYLASREGVPVQGLTAEHLALQLLPPECRPHLFEDAVGQLFLFRVWEGDIEMRRRRSLSLPWEAPRLVTQDGESDYPWATKDAQGRMILVRQRGGLTVVTRSRDEGRTWEE